MTLIEQALTSATDTAEVVFGPGSITQTGEVFVRRFGGARAIIVADENTDAVAGTAVRESLERAGVSLAEPYVFAGKPVLYAKYENIVILRDYLADLDAVAVAIGSGTLNDIVKRASGELERGYLVVGTAPSMDGYTAFGASISVDGAKQTLSCPAPVAMIADINVMAAAPDRMLASGYGDLIGKVPAGADWIIAGTLGIESVDQDVWALVQGTLPQAIADPQALAAHDAGAVADLAEGLVMSGLAMQMHQSSRPASGAEHQFSHLWEMEGLGVHDDPPLSHGYKVGLGTISICALYEQLLAFDLGALDIEAAVNAWPSRTEMEQRVRAAHHHPGLREVAIAQTLGKYIDAQALHRRLELLVEAWPKLRRSIVAQLLPAAEVEARLAAVGAPTRPEQIGLDAAALRETYSRSQMIRSRYTVLDVADEAGILDLLVDKLFAPQGFWGSRL